ncbi:MAG: HIT domain-containing protein [Phycisphaeraceae bacterium]|nr:MAG: HIT domain-containing protein [Phycisphaeraceae bacterium]
MTPTRPNEPSDRSAGPDAIWAPWRLQYLESLDEPTPGPGSSKDGGPSASEGAKPCFLERYWSHPEHDEAHHVIYRDEHGLILLNAFPYSNGHLLVALGEGRPRLVDYTAEQRAWLWSLVDRAADLVERALSPQGLNIGVNQGHAAGAGVPGHLHVHLVPRWGGDVNFITTVGQVRVIPSSLEAMAKRYRAVIDKSGS